jgi:hypothetical protein
MPVKAALEVSVNCTATPTHAVEFAADEVNPALALFTEIVSGPTMNLLQPFTSLKTSVGLNLPGRT